MHVLNWATIANGHKVIKVETDPVPRLGQRGGCVGKEEDCSGLIDGRCQPLMIDKTVDVDLASEKV